MRRFIRFLMIIVFLVVVVSVFAPLIIGIQLQKSTDTRFFFNNTLVQIINYQRHWFSSDATYQIKITDPQLIEMIEKVGLNNPDHSDSIVWIVKQHIQHGPVFYSSATHLPSLFGLAAIKHQFSTPSTEKNKEKRLALHYQVYLSFSGNYFYYFQIPSLNTVFQGAQIQWHSLEGAIWHRPLSKRFQGHISTDRFSLSNNSYTILLPTLVIQFNLEKDDHGLWIGDQSISIPDIVAQNNGNPLFTVKGVEYSGYVKESSHLVDAERQLTIETLQTEWLPVGPLHLQMSASHLKAQAIADLIDAYVDIAHYGELYESQLRQKILFMLPNIITSGATIQLDNLAVATPHGRLQMHAIFSWPSENFSALSSMNELVDTANVNASLRISIPLVDSIIKMVSKLTYLYPIPLDIRLELLAVQNTIRLNLQENADMILDLIRGGSLSENEGKRLFMMMRNNVPTHDYLAVIKQLFLEKKINRDVSYWLGWHYRALKDQESLLQQHLLEIEQSINEQWHAQIENYINQGYIVRDKKDYVISVVRDSKQVILNGSPLEE